MQSVEKFRAFLRVKSLRVTPVREAIVKAVVTRKGHFHIDELVRDLRGKGVDASRATVYRSLPLLVEAGLVQPTIVSGNGHYYETAVGHEHHDHLVCSECDKVVEFQFEAFEILQREVAAKYGFELTSHFHELIGVCPECQGRQAHEN
jgi:Fur family ferric uptake transcriptional regulator